MRLIEPRSMRMMLAEPVLQAELACPAPPESTEQTDRTSIPATPAPSAIQPLRAPLLPANLSAIQKPAKSGPLPLTTTASIESRLTQLLELPLPQGREIVRNDRDDGGVMTYEQLDDGSSVNRTFSARGELRGESLVTIGGEEVQKSYDEDGRLKAMSWVRPDGTRTDVKLTPNGLFEGRQDLAADGTRIVTKFDERGEVASRWRILRNGHSIKL